MLRGLPRSVWLLQAGGLVNAFGNGLVIPFLLIYLNNVRGLSVAQAGLVAGANGAVALTTGLVAGSLSDRIGPRRVLIGSLLVMTLAFALFPLVRAFGEAIVLSGLGGAGAGAFRASQATMLTALAPKARRHTAFAQQFMALNLGLGTGHLAGGLIATTDHPSSFTVLFLLDALTFLVFAAVLLTVEEPRTTISSHSRGGYREVLRDRVFTRLMILNLVFVAAAIAPFMNLFPIFAKNQSAVEERGIGFVFFLNTVAVLVLQLPITRLLEGRRRMPVLGVMAAIWAAAWLLVPVGGASYEAFTATAVFAVAAMVFGIGECLHSAIVGPLIADLASAERRGRYLGVSTLVWQLGFFVGPSTGGVVLGASPRLLWPGLAALCVVAGIGALVLEPQIPAEVRKTPITARRKTMKWVTRKNAKVDRVACPWLIRRFVDREAQFLFVDADRVTQVAAEENAVPYDVPGVELGHVDGRCSFEAILRKYRLDDPALHMLASVVHGADVSADRAVVPEAAGLYAIAHGFALVHGDNDAEKLRLEWPMYDALYAWSRSEVDRNQEAVAESGSLRQ